MPSGVPKTTLVGAFITLWLLVGLACCVLLRSGNAEWIALFNSGDSFDSFYKPVTQPTVGPPAFDVTTFLFLAVLALRTALNLGLPLSAVIAAVWLYRGGLEALMTKYESVSKMRDKLVALEAIAELRERNVEVPREVEASVLARVKNFDSSKLGKTVNAVRAKSAKELGASSAG